MVTGRRPPLVRRGAWKAGMIGALAAAGLMALVVSAFGLSGLFRNDGETYLMVAGDPFGDGSVFRDIPGAAEQYGAAYRYGRILYPLTAWTLSGGQGGLPVELALVVVDVVAAGVAVALAAELAARRGVALSRGLAILAVPAMWIACVFAVSEPLVLTLVLLTYLLVLDGRERPALVTGALLLLAREAAVLALVPLVLAAWRRRDRAALVGWALVPVPLLAWWAWVWARVGDLPLLDPSVSRSEAMALPPEGVATAVREGLTTDHVVAFALAAGAVVAAVWVWRRARWWPVTDAALLFAISLVFLGPNAWRYPVEAMRVMGPAHALVVLSLVTARGARAPAEREPSQPLVATP